MLITQWTDHVNDFLANGVMPPCKVICRIFLATEKKYFAWHWTTEIFSLRRNIPTEKKYFAWHSTTEIFSPVKYWFFKRRKFFLLPTEIFSRVKYWFCKRRKFFLLPREIFICQGFWRRKLYLSIYQQFPFYQCNKYNQLFKIQSTFKIVHHTLSCFLV